MAWQLTVYTPLAALTVAISLVIAFLAWRNRRQRGAQPLALLMVALTGWALAAGIQLAFTGAWEQDLWKRIGLAFGAYIPALWVWFAVTYAGREEWLTRPRTIVLAIEAVLFSLLTLTNPLHHLIWTDGTVQPTVGGDVLELAYSVSFYAHMIWAYCVIVVGLVILIGVVTDTSHLYQRQAGLLLLAPVPPTFASVAYVLRLSGGPLPALDPTPFAFVVTGILVGLALFRFDLLDRTPIARQRAFDEMGDGLLVMDTLGRVVHMNEIASQILDANPTETPIDGTRHAGNGWTALQFDGDGGLSVTAASESDGSTTAALRAIDGQTVDMQNGNVLHCYDADWTPLTDQHGEEVGHVVVFRDVTDRARYQQRLEVAQRVLRHNLRNDINVIQAHATHIARNGDPEQVHSAERITQTTEELIELSEKTRTMVRMEEAYASDWHSIDVGMTISQLVTQFRGTYPAATIDASIDAGTTVSLPDEQFLSVPVENLLENAIEHSAKQPPQIEVSVRERDARIEVQVSDNCPKIPAVERQVLNRGGETPLEHGSGIGLWLVHWSLETVGGTVSFEYTGEGNVVTLAYPRAEESEA